MTREQTCVRCGYHPRGNEVEAGLFNTRAQLCMGCDYYVTGTRLLALILLSSALLFGVVVASIFVPPMPDVVVKLAQSRIEAAK